MVISHTVTVRGPVEQVFDFYADPFGAAVVDRRVKVTLLAGGPVGVGTRTRIEGRGRPFEVETVEYERPARLAFRMTYPGRSDWIDGAQHFEASPGGTRVANTAAYHLSTRLLSVLMWILAPWVRRSFRKSLLHTATVAEAAIAAGS